MVSILEVCKIHNIVKLPTKSKCTFKTQLFFIYFFFHGLLLIMVQTNTSAHVPTVHNHVSDTSMLFAKTTLKLK